jgi:hypothetical protein
MRKNTYFTWFVQIQHKSLTNHHKAPLIHRQVKHADILDFDGCHGQPRRRQPCLSTYMAPDKKCRDKTKRLAEMSGCSKI